MSNRITHSELESYLWGAATLLRVIRQPAEVRPIVSLGEETRLTMVAALNQVHRYPGKGDAWLSWHLGIILE